MRTRSLTDLIADVRARSNQENSTFVTDAEITEYLNQELAELWAHMTQGSAAPHYRSSTTFAVSSGTALYPLPADFWQLQGVEAQIGASTVALRPFMPSQHAAMSSTGGPFGVTLPIRYRLQADNIEFLPANQSFTATVYYTRSAPRLSAGADTVDGFNGFEMAALYGTVATILNKEESDPSFYLAQKDRIYRHIDSLASQRDAAEPDQVQDVTGLDTRVGYFPFGWL